VSAAVLRLVVRALARLVLAIVGVRHTTRGAFPDGPALLVANHLGWLDIVVLVARADCAFVAKREVSQWPVIGAVGRRLGVVFVERRPSRDLRRAVSELEARLREGAKVVLFPEGTTTDGRTVLPFKSSLVEAAVRAEAPVIPIALRARAISDPSPLCWVGDETLLANLPRVRACRGARIDVDIGDPLVATTGRKIVSVQARATIVDRLRRWALAGRCTPPRLTAAS